MKPHTEGSGETERALMIWFEFLDPAMPEAGITLWSSQLREHFFSLSELEMCFYHLQLKRS